MYENTIETFKREGFPTLFYEIMKQARQRSIEDTITMLLEVNRIGIDAAFPGFTFYHETSEFLDTHEDTIMDYIDDYVADHAYPNAWALVASTTDALLPRTVAQLKNWLVWFFVEDTALQIHRVAAKVGDIA